MSRDDWTRLAVMVPGALVFVAVMFTFAALLSDERRDPPPEPRREEVFVDEARVRMSRWGTAFAIEGRWWLTAAHVTDLCDRVEVLTASNQWKEARVANPRREDLSVLSTTPPPRPLRLRTDEPPPSDAKALGFPQGGPRELWLQFLGFGTVHRMAPDSPRIDRVQVWALPTGTTSGLGGLSGGPVVEAAGRALGMVTTAHLRRGRLYAIPAVTLAAAAQGVPPALPEAGGNRENDAMSSEPRNPADILRTAWGAVAPVRCHVEGVPRRPPDE